MSIDNNLYEKSIKILTDLIAFKTISGQDNSNLIDYCEKILNNIGIATFKVSDDDKKKCLYSVKKEERQIYGSHAKAISSFDLNHLIKHGIKK